MHFDISSLVHFEFIPQGKTVNQAYFMEVFKRLRETVLRKGYNDWILHHDNAPAHKTFSVKQFMAKKTDY
jgi:hypothetical protein